MEISVHYTNARKNIYTPLSLSNYIFLLYCMLKLYEIIIFMSQDIKINVI